MKQAIPVATLQAVTEEMTIPLPTGQIQLREKVGQRLPVTVKAEEVKKGLAVVPAAAGICR